MHPSVTQVVFWPALEHSYTQISKQIKVLHVFQCILILTVAVSAWSAVRIVLHMSDAGHVAVCKFSLYVHVVYSLVVDPNYRAKSSLRSLPTTCSYYLHCMASV